MHPGFFYALFTNNNNAVGDFGVRQKPETW